MREAPDLNGGLIEPRRQQGGSSDPEIDRGRPRFQCRFPSGGSGLHDSFKRRNFKPITRHRGGWRRGSQVQRIRRFNRNVEESQVGEKGDSQEEDQGRDP